MKALSTLFLLAIAMLGLTRVEAAKIELTADQLARVKSAVETLIKETHDDLNNETNGRKRKFQLEFYGIKNPNYFMESNFTIGRFFLGAPNYRIGINPLIFEKNITDEALKGVLAHELIHSEDYYNGSTLRTIIPIAFKVMKKKSRRQYERKTDLKVILKGLARELIAYKRWQYPLLTDEALKTKKLEYLTPEEVELVDSVREKYPQLMQKWLKKKIPGSYNAMIKAIAEHQE